MDNVEKQLWSPNKNEEIYAQVAELLFGLGSDGEI